MYYCDYKKYRIEWYTSVYIYKSKTTIILNYFIIGYMLYK